ncbi:MAG: 50S ribosomal protein L11 methyltransferase [Sinobacteraceae bacterium]|nr:50S ribosomal protein L11 methyltransferase [Nevskiaceae bacterium]
MPWKELTVSSAWPEFAEELLLAAGAQTVTLRDGADTPLLEPAPGETPLWPTTQTVGLFNHDADLEAARKLIREALPADDTPQFLERDVADADWVHLWQDNVAPMHFGGRLWVRPAHKSLPDNAGPEPVIIDLDPGLAFGTGTHPSTALCLRWLAQLPLAGCTVLDYGCGSGILAIAALKLGAVQAWATDIDSQALEATDENATRNGVRDKLRIVAPEAVPDSMTADIILANIVASPLMQLAPRLTASARHGARLALAGLLVEQANMIRQAYETAWTFDAPTAVDGWLRLTASRR